MNMKDLLFEKIINDINNIIVENLSIANELAKSAYDVTNEIENDIKNVRPIITKIRGVTFKRNTISVNVEAISQVVKITYWYYNFMTEELKRKELHKIKFRDKVDENSITITIISVAGDIDSNSLHDSIYHELEHMYQLQKRGKEFITDKDNIYYYAHILMNKLPIHSYGYMIATCLYLSEAFEQDAYVNGMYGTVMSRVKNFWDINKEFQKTNAYQGLQNFEQYLEVLKSSKEDIVQTLNKYFYEYNITYDNMIPYFENRLKRFKTKVGKVLTKMQEDYKEQNKDRVKLPSKISFI